MEVVKAHCAFCHIEFTLHNAAQIAAFRAGRNVFDRKFCRVRFPHHGGPHHKICKHCKKPFTTKKADKEYCTVKCWRASDEWLARRTGTYEAFLIPAFRNQARRKQRGLA